MPSQAGLIYQQGTQPTEADLHAQLYQLEKYYRVQEDALVRQFESQRRMLAHQHQVKMAEQVQVMLVLKHITTLVGDAVIVGFVKLSNVMIVVGIISIDCTYCTYWLVLNV